MNGVPQTKASASADVVPGPRATPSEATTPGVPMVGMSHVLVLALVVRSLLQVERQEGQLALWIIGALLVVHATQVAVDLLALFGTADDQAALDGWTSGVLRALRLGAHPVLLSVA